MWHHSRFDRTHLSCSALHQGGRTFGGFCSLFHTGYHPGRKETVAEAYSVGIV